VDGMGHYMYEVWRDADMARVLGDNARVKAAKEFDMERQSEELKRVILSALGTG